MRKSCLITLLMLLLGSYAFAQKVQVGFDKSVDFSKYRTFSWPRSDEAPEMTIRRAAVMGEIEYALKSKGLTKVEQAGELILSGFGSFGGEMGGDTQGAALLPTLSSSTYPTGAMWTGTSGGPGATVIKGTLVLQMTDRKSGVVVWQGSVTQKVDQENKEKTLKRIKAAIIKLLEQYPPKRS